MDIGAVYHDTRIRVISLVRDLTPGEAEMRVPACPAWTLRDLVSHSAGVVADLLGGRTEGVATDPWTARQVEERRGRSLDQLLAEWDEGASALEPRLSALPRISGIMLVADLETHEQDVRGALNRPGGRDSEGYALALEAMTGALGRRLKQTGLPGLRVRTEGGDMQVRSGEPAATVIVPQFEFFRAISGRRSLRQMAAFGWEGQYEPYLPLLPMWTPPEADILE